MDLNPIPFPLILADSEEFGQKIDEFGIPIYSNKITGDIFPTAIHNIVKFNYHVFFSMFLMSVSTACPTSFKKVFALKDWYPPIFKEMDNFIDNNCFHWIKDIRQRRLIMMWLFSIKSDMALVVRGGLCQPGIDYNPEEVYCGNVTATSIKISFVLSDLYGLILKG